jgi:hypothetical protein
MNPSKTDVDSAVTIKEWVGTVEALASDVLRWARSRDWSVAMLDKEITEEGLGTYWAKTLQIQTANGTLMLDPVARHILGRGEGRVDLMAFPSLVRFLLIRDGDQWKILTDAGVAWPLPWSEETFIKLAIELTRV